MSEHRSMWWHMPSFRPYWGKPGFSIHLACFAKKSSFFAELQYVNGDIWPRRKQQTLNLFRDSMRFSCKGGLLQEPGVLRNWFSSHLTGVNKRFQIGTILPPSSTYPIFPHSIFRKKLPPAGHWWNYTPQTLTLMMTDKWLLSLAVNWDWFK